jgi:serine/threonine protein kinase/WD40 repeat protein
MPELKKCRACGVDVQSNAPSGHCPQCLLELGFGAMPKDAVESSAQSAIPNPQSAIETVRYFGDYELLEQIGRGGMGIVYKARQQSLNRIVALKMISAGEFASPSAVQRFQIEAEAAAKLDHPNIVPIYEIGVHRGQHYFSMKFVEGRSLAEEIGDGKFHFSTGGNPASKVAERERQSAIARLMTTVAHSVHCAHQHGVIHRDLKPSNVLVDAEGEPHLTDFGLAKLLEHEVGVTGSAEVMGTASYMSPEQAAGKRLSTATDVYSLGAILYELLTGKPPFTGATPNEILHLVAESDPVRPRSLNSSVNEDLEIICLKCLEKEPQRRYLSARALVEELERWLNGEPILARPTGLFEKTWRTARRHKVASALIVSLAVMVASIIVVLLFSTARIDRARNAEVAHRRKAEDTAMYMRLQRASQLIETGRTDDGLAHLAAAVRSDPSNRVAIERLLFALTYRSTPHGSKVFRSPMSQSYEVSPQRDRVVAGTLQQPEGIRRILIFDPASGRPIAEPLSHGSNIWGELFTLSSDGRRLITQASDTFRLWDTYLGTPLNDAARGIAHFCANDSNLLVRQQGTWRIIDPVSDKTLGSFVGQAGLLYDRLSILDASGSRILVLSSNSWDVFDCRDGSHLFGPAVIPSDSQPSEFRLGPDGATVVGISTNRLIRMWSVSNLIEFASTTNWMTPKWSYQSHGLQFSRDGAHMLVASPASWEVWNLRTMTMQARVNSGFSQITPSRVDAIQRVSAPVTLSPNGRWVLTFPDRAHAQVWSAQTGETVGPLLQCRGERTFERDPIGPVFSPDGDQLLGISIDPEWRSWLLTMRPGAPSFVTNLPMYAGNGATFLGTNRVAMALVDTIRICNDDGKVVMDDVRIPAPITGLKATPDGTMIIARFWWDHYRVWDVRDRSFKPPREQFPRFPKAISKDGVWTAVSAPGGVQIWKRNATSPASPILKYSPSPNQQAQGNFTPESGKTWATTKFVEFTADNTRLVFGGGTRYSVWSINESRILQTIRQPHRLATQPRLSSDGKTLITLVWDTNRPIAKPQMLSRTGKIVPYPGVATEFVPFLQLMLVRWDLKTGIPLATTLLDSRGFIVGGGVISLSPDGRRVFSAHGSVQEMQTFGNLWNCETTGVTYSISFPCHSRFPSAVEFSNDSLKLLTCSDDNTARIWDTKDGHPLTPPLQHGSSVRTGRFSPDDLWVVTGTEDHNVRIWSSITGEAVTEPLQHAGWTVPKFSTDGTRVLTSRLWDAQYGIPLTEPELKLDGDAWLADGLANGSTNIWKFPHAPVPAPAWLPSLAEAVASKRMNSSRSLEFFASSPQELKSAALSSTPSRFYRQWAEWFFEEPHKRAPSPFP